MVGGTGVITIQWRAKIACECDKRLDHLGQTILVLRGRIVQRERKERGLKNAKNDFKSHREYYYVYLIYLLYVCCVYIYIHI